MATAGHGKKTNTARCQGPAPEPAKTMRRQQVLCTTLPESCGTCMRAACRVSGALRTAARAPRKLAAAVCQQPPFSPGQPSPPARTLLGAAPPAAKQPWRRRRTHASPTAGSASGSASRERCACARLRLPCPLPPCLRPTAAPARTPRCAAVCERPCGCLPCPTPLRRAAARAHRRAPARSRRRRTRGPHGARRRRAAARRPWAQAARNRSRRPAAQAAGCETGRSRAPHANANHTAGAFEGRRCAVVGPTSVRASESRSCPNASSLYVAKASPDTFPGMPASPDHGL